MTFFDTAVALMGLAFGGASYLYLLKERRKLRADRAHRHAHPAE